MKSNYSLLQALHHNMFQLNQGWRVIVAIVIVGAVGCGAKQDPAAVVIDAGEHNAAATHDAATESVLTTPTTSRTDTAAIVSASTLETDAGTQGSATTGSAEISSSCGSAACACNDGMDNDGDGVLDGMDPECTGPFDDEEATFATGIPGDNRDPKWQDCFFDGNSGAGDDGCRYHTDCLTGDKAADDQSCVLAQECIDFCQPLTPPSCDCFGCCEVPFEGATVGIYLSEDCSLDKVGDTDACPRCTLATACSNDCGECELCLGKTLEDLPAYCWDNDAPPSQGDAGTPNSEDAGEVPMGDAGPDVPPMVPEVPGNTCDNEDPCASNADCAVGEYCRLGCCVDYAPQVF